MENVIMAYSLGVLTVALIGAVITGVRLNKRVNELEKLSQNNSQKIDEIATTLHTEICDTHRRLDEKSNSIYESMDKRFDDVHRMVDSRIDKMINNPKFCLNK